MHQVTDSEFQYAVIVSVTGGYLPNPNNPNNDYVRPIVKNKISIHKAVCVVMNPKYWIIDIDELNVNPMSKDGNNVNIPLKPQYDN